jgi:hypothetical protein
VYSPDAPAYAQTLVWSNAAPAWIAGIADCPSIRL